MPGADEYDGVPLETLRMNPFQPATIPGQSPDYSGRYERLSAVLAASLPMADILPLILEECIFRYMQARIGVAFAERSMAEAETHPRLDGLADMVKKVVRARGYEQRIQENLVAALETRIGALTRGRRGQTLNVDRSTPVKDLFERPVVVNFSLITDDRDKALFMSLLTMSLAEYRLARFRYDREYREQAKADNLCHLTVIEEAHRLLRNPGGDTTGIGNPQAVVSGMFSDILSEMRGLGEGIMIVDQIPSRLIPDAVKNTNFKIVHRLVARDEREAMAGCTGLRQDQAELIAVLPVGEAIISSDQDDVASWIRVQR
jgi:hypothetical protein